MGYANMKQQKRHVKELHRTQRMNYEGIFSDRKPKTIPMIEMPKLNLFQRIRKTLNF
jgi:hypothetical protein